MKVSPITVMRNESAMGGRRSSRIALVEEGEAEINSAVLPEGQGFDSPLPKLNKMFQSEKKPVNDISESPSPQTKHKRVKSAKVHNTHDIHNSWYTETEHPTNWIFKEDLPNFPSETKSLRVLTITWNLHGKRPKEELLNVLFNKENAKHHIIAIGTEECLRSIPMSTLYESKSYWVNLLRNHLSPEYVMVKSHSMNALHLTLFVHKDLYTNVRNIESSQVATGIGNFIGNKGGIGITFTLYGLSFLFINCHLASGQKQAAQRNADFNRIMNELELPKARVAQEKKMKQRTRLVDRFDAVFWSGDFNYRVNQTRENTVHMIKEKNLEFLLNDDQMLLERKCSKVFEGFQEGDIKFAPTYKYQGGTNLYDSKKKRTPSWTDRILYFNGKKNVENGNTAERRATVEILNYETIQSLVISDHRPVFGQFEVTYTETPQPVDESEKFVKVKTNACSIF